MAYYIDPLPPCQTCMKRVATCEIKTSGTVVISRHCGSCAKKALKHLNAITDRKAGQQ